MLLILNVNIIIIIVDDINIPKQSGYSLSIDSAIKNSWCTKEGISISNIYTRLSFGLANLVNTYLR